MPSRIKVRIYAARDLPVMDPASNLTDAYVEIKLSDLYDEKTEIARKTLNPVWNQDFRIEVPHDSTLRKHPLEFKVWDQDQFSKDDIIGNVFLDLNNVLLYKDSSEITGWFPIYDTFRGIRGELKVSVKIEFFGQLNSGIDNPTGIVFLSARRLIHQVKLKDIQGFVEELLVDDDPEYNWKDNFRTSRSSNEARQYLLYKLSGKLRRQIGNKVIELGGNAVLGYNVHFDFAETCIVARGYGTCCTLKTIRKPLPPKAPLHDAAPAPGTSTQTSSPHAVSTTNSGEITPENVDGEILLAESNGSLHLGNLASIDDMGMNGSSDTVYIPSSDVAELGTVDLVASAAAGNSGNVAAAVAAATKTAQKKENFAVLRLQSDIMLVTMHSFPNPVLLRLSGVVTARAIKVIPRVRSEDQNQAIRDSWWSEVREEIRSHARFLNCQFVIGYTESASIKDDIMILTASGTAANLKLPTKKIRETNEERVVELRGRQKPCSFCHIPYSQDDSPFPMRLVPCLSCGKKLVPEVLLATVDPPPGMPILGRGQLVEARVCRAKKKLTGEAGAVLVSELIPFLEYDLHKQLIYKMRLLGMNACFGVRTQLCVGDDTILAVLQGTAVCLPALPRPEPLLISGKSQDSLHLHSRLNQLSLHNSAKLNRVPAEEYPNFLQHHGQEDTTPSGETQGNMSTLLQSIQLAAEIEPTTKSDVGDTNVVPEASGKTTYVVELDDKLDEDLINLLLEPPMLKDYFMCNTEVLPGIRFADLSNMQCISLVRSIPAVDPDKDDNPDQLIAQAFASIYTNLMFKLRNMRPCCLCGVKTEVQMDDDDDIQVVLTAMVLTIEKESEKASNTDSEDAVPPLLLSGSAKRVDDSIVSPRGKASNSKLKSPESAKNLAAARSAGRRKGKRRPKEESSSDTDDSESESSDSDTSDDERTSPRTGTAPKPIPGRSSPRGITSPRRSPRNKESRSQLATSVSSFSPSSPLSFEDKIRPKLRGSVGDSSSDDEDRAAVKRKRSKSGLRGDTEGETTDDDVSKAKRASDADMSPPTSTKKSRGKKSRTHQKKTSKDDSSESLSDISEDEAESEDSDSDKAKAKSKDTKQKRRRSQRRPAKKRANRQKEADKRRRPAESSSDDDSSSSSSEDDVLPSTSPAASSSLILNMAAAAAAAKKAQPKMQKLNRTSRVEITPLSYIPGARIVKICGRLSLHFVKETHTIREQGGMGSFAFTLLLEAQKVARAHVHNLGGNCMTSFQLDQCIFVEKPNKNQGYVLVNLSGDAMLVEYSDESSRGHDRIVHASTNPREEWF